MKVTYHNKKQYFGSGNNTEKVMPTGETQA